MAPKPVEGREADRLSTPRRLSGQPGYPVSRFIGIGSSDHNCGPVVVIDVFRAFTVALLALDKGAERVVLVGTPGKAQQLKRETPGSLAIKDGPPEDGFDLVNSPASVIRADVAGRTIVMRTTNGTRGALANGDCEVLFCASFVCASATANALRRTGESVTYIITGGDGTAEEDLACAHLIDELIRNPETDAEPYLHRAQESKAADDLRRGIRLGYKGVDELDIALCLEVDRVKFACRASHEPLGMVLRKFGARDRLRASVP